MVVQGAVNPDEFYVYKPTLRAGQAGDPAPLARQQADPHGVFRRSPASACATRTRRPSCAARSRISDADVQELARQALVIEQHYGRPMDIEWAKDGVTGKLFIVQARPETVKSRAPRHADRALPPRRARRRCSPKAARSARRSAAASRAWCASLDDMSRVQPGDVLVADMTDPDWEPVMKRAAAIVTNRGGRTCHAAIIARELGVPAVVGTGDALDRIKDGDRGHGQLRRRRHRLHLRRHPALRAHRPPTSATCRRRR